MEMYIGTILIWPIDFAPLDTFSCNGQVIQVGQYQALYSLIGNVYGGSASQSFAVPNLINRVPYGSTSLALGCNGGPITPMGSTGPYGPSASLTGSLQGVLQAANLPGHTHPATFIATMGTTQVNVSAPAQSIPVALPVASTAPTAAPPATLSGNVYLANAAASAPAGLKGIYQTTEPSSTVNLQGGTASGNPGGSFTGTISVVTGGTVSVASNNTGAPQPFTLSAATAKTDPLPPPPFLALNFIIVTNGIYPPRP
jgi:microcystin-dependent protein